MIELARVKLRHAGAKHPVVDGLTLRIESGELTAIVGPNGAGKSTLLAAMAGTMQPESGTASIDGQDLAHLPRREAARRIAVVPQSEFPAFSFSVFDTVLMGRSPWLDGFLGVPGPKDEEIARWALGQVELDHLSQRPLATLSGGERQLALIARALAQQAPLLVMDEPTAALDLAHQQQIMRIVEKTNRECGVTAVIVAHDLNLAARWCRRLIVMKEGRIVADGPPADVITAERIEQVYGAQTWLVQGPDGLPFVGLRH